VKDRAQQNVAAGPPRHDAGAKALAPPSYGIDFVDRGFPVQQRRGRIKPVLQARGPAQLKIAMTAAALEQGTSTGWNLFFTRLYQQIVDKTRVYQENKDPGQERRLLGEIRTLCDQWLAHEDNQPREAKAADAADAAKVRNKNAKRAKIFELWRQIEVEAPMPAAARERPVAGDEKDPARIARAKRIFQAAEVRNYTSVEHQLVQDGKWSGKPADHVVNKWERTASGEKGFGGAEFYPPPPAADGKADAKADVKKPEPKTLAKEAEQLGYDNANDYKAYRDLPRRARMQFAVLDYDPSVRVTYEGWGGSYFVVKRSKCERDGFIHLGDSLYDQFPSGKGRYQDFPAKLDTDAEAVNALLTPDPEKWIEVNLRDGVRLPQDVDKFVVHAGELKRAAAEVPDDKEGKLSADDKVTMATGALAAVFPRVEIKNKP